MRRAAPIAREIVIEWGEQLCASRASAGAVRASKI
jgi:hypothetical protein